jgi:hypothetical protein
LEAIDSVFPHNAGLKAPLLQKEPDNFVERPRSLLTPVVMLLVAACVLSYLACFAVPAALVGAELMSPWPANADPRPLWMLHTFCWLMGTMVMLGGIMRFLSWRQCRRIDAIAE